MDAHNRTMRIRELVAEVPDFPSPGIAFKDITSLLASPEGMALATEALGASLQGYDFDALVAIESRGFIFGAALAARMDIPLVLARKPGKLPRAVQRMEYQLEYGSDAIEVHREDVRSGTRFALIDDLIATGGTARATVEVLRSLGADVIVGAFLIELESLAGRRRLDVPIESIITYE